MTRLQKKVSVFQGGQMTPLALACGRPWVSENSVGRSKCSMKTDDCCAPSLGTLHTDTQSSRCRCISWSLLGLWDSNAVFITQNLDVGYNVDQLDLHAYIGKTKVGIPNTCTHCSYYCTFYLVMYRYLVIILLQNKLTITFNKMITSGRYDWS